LAGDPAGRPAADRRPPATHGRDDLDRIVLLRIGPSLQRGDGAVARLRTASATSAGGIVVRFDDGLPSLVIGARRRDRDVFTWTLPKGTPTAGETREETALREVAEETGLEVRITDILDSIEYSFVQRGTRIHKTVHYFLMEPIGGDLGHHDHEFDDVRWVRFDEAPRFLTFETERALVARAAEVVSPPATRAEATTSAPSAAPAPSAAQAPSGAAAASIGRGGSPVGGA
jgi:8-oxo-dGTP pyrophosphatase MutT (NUDIX family)